MLFRSLAQNNEADVSEMRRRLALESSELEQLKMQLKMLQSRNEELSNENDQLSTNLDRTSRALKEEKLCNDALSNSLKRSQDQERKIYERLRLEKRHQQGLWQEIIENNDNIVIHDSTRNSSMTTLADIPEVEV